jgi:hypothetical protein
MITPGVDAAPNWAYPTPHLGTGQRPRRSAKGGLQELARGHSGHQALSRAGNLARVDRVHGRASIGRRLPAA